MEHRILLLETGSVTTTQVRRIIKRIEKLRKLKRANEFNNTMYDHLLKIAGISKPNFREFEVRGVFPDLTYLARDYILKNREKIHLGSQIYRHDKILSLRG